MTISYIKRHKLNKSFELITIHNMRREPEARAKELIPVVANFVEDYFDLQHGAVDAKGAFKNLDMDEISMAVDVIDNCLNRQKCDFPAIKKVEDMQWTYHHLYF